MAGETTLKAPQQQRADPLLMGRLFESPEGWERVVGKAQAAVIDSALADSEDPRTDRMRFAEAAFYADAFQVEPEEVAGALEVYRDSWHQQVLKQPTGDDAQAYANIGAFLGKQNRQSKMLQDQFPVLMDTFALGGEFEDAWQQISDKWGNTEGWDWENLDAYRQFHVERWNQLAEQADKLAPALDAVGRYYSAEKGRIPGLGMAFDQEALRKGAIASLAGLTPDEQEMVLGLSSTRAAQAEGGQTGMIGKTAQSIGRGFEFGLREAGRGINALTQAPLESQFVASDQVKADDAARRLDRYLAGKADPARASSWAANGFLSAANNLPRLLASLHPAGLAANATSYVSEVRGDMLDRGMTDAQANLWAPVAAVPYAALDFLEARFVFKGAVAGFEKAMLKGAGTGLGMARNVALRATVGLGEQYAQEVLQDLTTPAVQALARTMDAAIPEVDWAQEWRQIGDAAPETLASLMWLTVVGSGVGAFRDRSYAKEMYKRETDLRAMGFSSAVVKRIMEADNPDDADLIVRLEWNNRRFGTQDQRDALAALDGEAAIFPQGYRIERDSGGYVVSAPSGVLVGTAANPETAADMALQHQASRSMRVDSPLAEQAFSPFGSIFTAEERAANRGFADVPIGQPLNAVEEAGMTAEIQAALAENAVVREVTGKLRENQTASEVRRTIEKQQGEKLRRAEDFTPARLQDWAQQLKEAFAANQAGGTQESVIFAPGTSEAEIQLLKLDVQGEAAQAERARLQAQTPQGQARARATEAVRQMVNGVRLTVAKAMAEPDPIGEATFPITPRNPNVTDAELRRSLPVPQGWTAKQALKAYRQLRAIDREVARLEDVRASGLTVHANTRRAAQSKIQQLLEQRLRLQADMGDTDAQDVLVRYEAEKEMAMESGPPRWARVLEWIRKHKLPSLVAMRKAGNPLAEDVASLDLPNAWFSKSQRGGLDQLEISLLDDLAAEGDLEANERRESRDAGTGTWLLEQIANARLMEKAGRNPDQPVDVPVIGVLSKVEAWANGVLERNRREGRLLAGDPVTFSALTVKGAFIIGRGVRDFTRWSAEMLKIGGEAIQDELGALYETAKVWAGQNARVAPLGKRYLVMEGVGKPEEQFQVWLPGDYGRGLTVGADQLASMGVSADVAPVESIGMQEGIPFEMVPMVQARLEAQGMAPESAAQVAADMARPQELFNATAQMGETPEGSTVTRATVNKAGMSVPADAKRGVVMGTSLEAWADRVLKERLVSLNTMDPELLAAFAIKGSALIEKGVREFGAWSSAMVNKFGESIRPHLESIWRESLAMAKPREAQAPGGPAVEIRPETPASVFDAEEPASKETVDKVVTGIKEAKPLERQTEGLYHRERQKRAARLFAIQEQKRGRASLRPMRSAMVGELPRMDFEPIIDRFTGEEVDSLFNHLLTHRALQGLAFTKASLANALEAMLAHGRIPTRGELEQFEVIFGPAFVKALLDKRSGLRKALDLLLEVLNLPRQLVSTFDLSASLRQGFTLAVSHPEVASRAFVAQLHAFANNDYAHALDLALHSGPQAEVRDSAGLYVPHVEGAAANIVDREERYQSRLMQKLKDVHAASPLLKAAFAPLKPLGWAAVASERAYITYLNKLRVEVFDSVDNQMVAAGLTEDQLAHERKKLALLINAATGRGNIKGSGTWQSVMNGLFFSPRFMVSRFEAPLRQAAYGTQGGMVGREAIRQMVAQVATWMALWTLCKIAFDDDDEVTFTVDPRSTDFLKWRLKGKTTIDTGAGYAQAWRLIARIGSGLTVDEKGKVSKIQLGGEIWRFFRYKLNPPASLAVSLREGKNVDGSPVSVQSAVVGLTVPLSLQTIWDVTHEHGAAGLLLTIPDVLGQGVQVYEDRPGRARPSTRKPPGNGEDVRF